MIGGIALAKMAVKKILGGGEDGEGILGGVFGLIENRQDRKKAVAEAGAAILTLFIEHGSLVATQQTELNKLDAANPSMFISGWRPAAAWICVSAFAYKFLVYNFIMWAWLYFGIQGEPPPNIETTELMPVLLGMLGLGGMRSVEKYHGVARKR